MKVAVIGAGWAGMAAAIEAAQAGHQLTVFEASRTLGGRARGLLARLPDGQDITVDNGQHILIGAYVDTLRLLERVGVAADAAFLRLPLTLRFPDGGGLQFPRLPVPLDALAGIAGVRGWPLRERLGLLATALSWKLGGFECPPALTVSKLCEGLGPHILRELIEPLCVSAMNTPASDASAAVFLRVLRDALFSVAKGSNLLLPRTDLSSLFPVAAAQALERCGGTLRSGVRVQALQAMDQGWQLDGEPFDAVLLATTPTEAARLVHAAGADTSHSDVFRDWAAKASALRFEAITTVYAWSPDARLPLPMLALRPSADAPAQFVFDRGQLGGPTGLLAFVVSASRGERDVLQEQVLLQARAQLQQDLQLVQTVVEKRATFACTPALARPAQSIAPGLQACGDYVAGPYPATLEGAVRSGLQAARSLSL